MQPLDGIKILDLTQLLPGPWCTMLLGDLGAQVLKIENPHKGGDVSREAYPRYRDGQSVYFASANRNKASAALDLRDPSDHARLMKWVEDADVVVQNFKPGTADRLKIGYEACRAVNPSIIYCAISGYGQTGPNSTLGGHDLNVAGMSGLLQPNEASAPRMPDVLMGDFGGATAATIAILAALNARARHGLGANIDAPMLDGVMAWSTISATRVFAEIADGDTRVVESSGGNPRYGIYKTADGKYMTVSLLERAYWEQFCHHIGRPELINPDEIEADRLTSHGVWGVAYREAIERYIGVHNRDELTRTFRSLELPILPVLTMREVYDRRAPDSEDAWFEFLDVEGHRTPQMGFPFRMVMSDGAKAFTIRKAPPRLNQNPDGFGGEDRK